MNSPPIREDWTNDKLNMGSSAACALKFQALEKKYYGARMKLFTVALCVEHQKYTWDLCLFVL